MIAAYQGICPTCRHNHDAPFLASEFTGGLAGWIRVEDRLPDNEDDLLFVMRDAVYIGRFLGYGPDKQTPRWDMDGCTGYLRVSHWMPMPKPPAC